MHIAQFRGNVEASCIKTGWHDYAPKI